MAHLFKPTYTKVTPETGERTTKTLRKWYAKYTDADGVVRRTALCEDKSAAQAMLADLIRNVERQIAGIIDPSTAQLKKPIQGFVDDYQRHLEVKARSDRHIAETIRLISIVLHETRCSVLGDLQSAGSALEEYLGKRLKSGVSYRTVNADLVAVRSFCRWLLSKKKYLLADPTIGLEPLNVEEDRRHERRALTDDEAQRLIKTTLSSPWTFRKLSGEDRAVIYMLAQRTGLRRGELLSLHAASFDLTVDPVTVTVKASHSKRRQTDVLPLPNDIADLVRQYLKTRTENGILWPGSWWRRSSKMFQRDLRDAGIEPVDKAGRVIDFHGQRTTFITSLARAGVAPATAQRLARHSDINLTMGVYTQLQAQDLHAALERLPTLHRTATPHEAAPHESKIKAASTELDADLRRIATAWPRLRKSIRQAILALITTE